MSIDIPMPSNSMALCTEQETALHSLPQSIYVFEHETPGAILSQPDDIEKSTKYLLDEATSGPVAASLQHMKADAAIIDSAQDVPAHFSYSEESVSLNNVLARDQ